MMFLFFLRLLLVTCFSPSSVQSASKCFNISIPYPFGIPGKGPSPLKGFEITCNPSGVGPMLPIGGTVYRILDISLLDGSVTIYGNSSFNLQGTIFTFSDTRNKFTALGCNVVAMLLNGSSGYSGGCASFCSTKNNIVNGSCSGVACCQAPVPKGLKKLELDFRSIPNKDNSTPSCSGAFIAEQNSYVFSSLDLNNTNYTNTQYRPVVLEWSIDDDSCEEVKRSASYACRENTYCYNSPNGIGYRCNCSQGFEGNPYLQGPEGCQGMSGDGLKEGSGCNGIGTLVIAIDPEVAEEAGMIHVKTVAQLAVRCLRLKGEERPRMIEVAIELEALRRLMRQHLTLKSNPLLQASMFHREMDNDTPLNLRVDGDGIAEDESMEIILLPPRNL
ncbi:hypothetical protein EJB05_39432, partial [Eragrostis curvula]